MEDRRVDVSTPAKGFMTTNRGGYNDHAFQRGDFSETKVAIYWELALVMCL